jgi:hypothetical protein
MMMVIHVKNLLSGRGVLGAGDMTWNYFITSPCNAAGGGLVRPWSQPYSLLLCHRVNMESARSQ